jgi:uncharacterized SAM-binding protein YcdF (DUF218 family)
MFTAPDEARLATKQRWRWGQRLALGFALGCLLLLALYVFRGPLCIGLARAWIVNEPIGKADAIVVLGGGLENRPFAAARLFRDRFAPKVLYMDVKASPTSELGITLPEREMNRRVLLSNGVPDTAMEGIGNAVASTYDESLAVRAWIEKTGAKSIIIPTDNFHTRRVRWLFRKQLKSTKAQIRVVAVEPFEYQTTNWWQREQGLIAFQNESIKMAYYRVRY